MSWILELEIEETLSTTTSNIARCLDEADTRPWTGELKNARAEMEALIFPTIERLLKKTGYKVLKND